MSPATSARRADFIHRLEVFPGGFHLGENFIRVLQQMPAGSGEIDVATESVEEPAFKFLFEGLDGVADGGLREMEFTGSLRKTSHAGERGEGEQLSAIEDRRHGTSGLE